MIGPTKSKKFEMVVGGILEMSQEEKIIFVEETKQDLYEIFGEDVSIDAVYKDIGKGFSSEVLTITIFSASMVATLFMHGKKIEDSLDAWLRLFKRVASYIRGKDKQHGIYVSHPIALGYAIYHITEKNSAIRRIELVSSTTITTGIHFGAENVDFEENPECVYSMVMMANDKELHFVGLKSDLELVFHHYIDVF